MEIDWSGWRWWHCESHSAGCAPPRGLAHTEPTLGLESPHTREHLHLGPLHLADTWCLHTSFLHSTITILRIMTSWRDVSQCVRYMWQVCTAYSEQWTVHCVQSIHQHLDWHSHCYISLLSSSHFNIINWFLHVNTWKLQSSRKQQQQSSHQS